MNAFSLAQCPICCRQFDANGVFLAHPRLSADAVVLECGATDCAAVAQANLAQEERWRRERAVRNRQRSVACGSKKLPAGQRAARVVENPRGMPSEREYEYRLPLGVVTTKDFSQADFVASGAAASANGKLVEFFSRPQNLGQWFKSTLLEDLCAGSRRMNNRAIDLRKHFLPKGLYLDNCMISPGEGLPKSSHYRLCFIEDAISLTAVQKQEFLVAAGLRRPVATTNEHE